LARSNGTATAVSVVNGVILQVQFENNRQDLQDSQD
jgi:hypothetical protein